jgi:hypothetical protein
MLYVVDVSVSDNRQLQRVLPVRSEGKCILGAVYLSKIPC